MIVGVTHDPVYGPAVLVGTGGVFAEVLKDVTVRPLPLDRRDAEDMVEAARLRPAAGARGQPRADVKALVDVVLAVARLAAACGERLVELDLNPVVVRRRGRWPSTPWWWRRASDGSGTVRRPAGTAGIGARRARARVPDLARAQRHRGGQAAEELWSRMVELDWPALTVPEADGGVGLGFVELAVVAEELGRVLSPAPFLATAAQFVPALLGGRGAPSSASGSSAPWRGDGVVGTLAVAEAAGSFGRRSPPPPCPTATAGPRR